MISFVRGTFFVLVATALVACESYGNSNSITDGGLDGGMLQDGLANVWVDPDGCQHWYVDDGVEGYMTPRLHRDGTPKCQDDRGEIVSKDGTVIETEQEPMGS